MPKKPYLLLQNSKIRYYPRTSTLIKQKFWEEFTMPIFLDKQIWNNYAQHHTQVLLKLNTDTHLAKQAAPLSSPTERHHISTPSHLSPPHYEIWILALFSILSHSPYTATTQHMKKCWNSFKIIQLNLKSQNCILFASILYKDVNVTKSWVHQSGGSVSTIKEQCDALPCWPWLTFELWTPAPTQWHPASSHYK